MEHYKKAMLLNDSVESKISKKKMIKVDNLSNGQYSANKNSYAKIRSV